MKIEIKCCEGNEQSEGSCLKDRCPIYERAKRQVDRTWPYVGTGYGNLYGEPKHRNYLARVRSNLDKNKK